MNQRAQGVRYIIQTIAVVVAVAVLAALIHLSMELRQVRQAIKTQTVQNIRATYARHFAHVTQSPDLADLLMRLTGDPEDADPGVKMRFYATGTFSTGE